jgi:hypothetical protein
MATVQLTTAAASSACSTPRMMPWVSSAATAVTKAPPK